MTVKNPKDFKISIKFMLVFFLTLLACYEIPSFINGSIRIYLNVAEISGTTGVNVFFLFGIGRIAELILMGPVFIVVYYIMMKYMLKKIDIDEGKNSSWVFLLEIGMIITISIVAMGIAIHTLFDYANHLYRIAYGGYDTTELFLFLYYSDEWLGHHLIHVGYYSAIVLALISEYLIAEQDRMSWEEILLTGFGAFNIFILNGYATYEGQCAFLLVLLSVILLITEIIVVSWKKVDPLKNPLLLASMIGSIIIIGFYVYWISVFGWKPYYPFFYQPSEL
ncbi:MAG: hypothetical protein ACTSVY_13060 [Candidatus Helarchaeota archaeon]